MVGVAVQVYDPVVTPTKETWSQLEAFVLNGCHFGMSEICVGIQPAGQMIE